MARPQAGNHWREIPTQVKDPSLVQARRRQIVDAAVKLFVEKGFHKTTTREIAKASGFSIGTLYEYVKSKEDVLYLVCEAIHQEMEEKITKRPQKKARGALELKEAVRGYLRVCDQMSDHILLIYQETKSLPLESMRYVLNHDEYITEMFAEILRQGVRDESLRPLSEAKMMLSAHNIVVLGHMWTFRRWSLQKLFSLDRYIEYQLEFLLKELAY
jgi:AcrR family transcriptional regulator